MSACNCMRDCICKGWWRLLCVSEWGASTSVIHPQANTIKKRHAPHSSALLLCPLLTQTAGLKWSGPLLFVWVSVHVRMSASGMNDLEWGLTTAENHGEQQRTFKYLSGGDSSVSGCLCPFTADKICIAVFHSLLQCCCGIFLGCFESLCCFYVNKSRCCTHEGALTMASQESPSNLSSRNDLKLMLALKGGNAFTKLWSRCVLGHKSWACMFCTTWACRNNGVAQL